MTPASHSVTQLLLDWNRGDREALDKLIPIVYAELRLRAARYLRRERPGHTLQTTALIHEAYLRLVEQREVRWQNRAHFFAISAQLMRRILVDHARGRDAAKRGGADLRVTLDDDLAAAAARDINILSLDEALTRLEKIDGRQSQVVELRYFSGLSIEETAEVLDVSPATVKLDWSMAKAWLRREMS
jgi:RNA polymerase sigma factor (TIGR02999 family)